MDPVFSNWVHIIKRVLIINRSRNSKSLKGIEFFEIQKMRFFNKVCFFSVSSCQLAMFQQFTRAALGFFKFAEYFFPDIY